MFFYLAPILWIAAADEPHYAVPGAAGLIDLRPLPDQAKPGLESGWWSLAWSREALKGAALLGEAGSMAEMKSTALLQDTFEALTGYRPAGDTLARLLWDCLTAGSDPTGDGFVRPLMPGTSGWLDLHCGGRVLSEPFEWGRHPHTSRVQDVLRADFARLFDQADKGNISADVPRKVLGFWLEQHKLRGADDWKLFVPAELIEHVAGPLKPETTITETFNTADSTTLGPLLTWTEMGGDWQVVSNRASLQTLNAATWARADSSLSSADHYSQISVITLNQPTGGSSAVTLVAPTVRFQTADGTTQTFYFADLRNWNLSSPADELRIVKRVAGTSTALAGPTASPISLPQTLKLSISGSSLEFFVDAVSKATVTDTAITGNLRTGFGGFIAQLSAGGALGDVVVDNFEAADLAGASILRTQIDRGLHRGICRGLTAGL